MAAGTDDYRMVGSYQFPKQAAFRSYLALVETMLADQGSLYVGPALVAADDPAGLERCFDRVYRLPVPSQDAALMFERLHQAPAGEPVHWELRQIAWRVSIAGIRAAGASLR